MKKIILPALCVLLLFPVKSLAQAYELPAGALQIETQTLKSRLHPNRALLLWMVNSERSVRSEDEDDPYTCPDETCGSCYVGPTRISLVDTRTRRVINTIKLLPEYNDGKDSFEIPYKIHNGYYYVPGVRAGKEGKPVIMWLKDYNGDGRAHEFALFHALACMGLPTTLIGYSESKDRVIQYPVNIEVSENGQRTRSTTYWPDYLFNRKPVRPGYWKFEIDYRGRAGDLDKWEVRYDKGREAFEAKLTTIPGD